MKFLKVSHFLYLYTVVFLFGCAYAPMNPSTSGKTIGKQKAALEIGNFGSSYYIKSMYGIADSLDIGYQLETGFISTTGLVVKANLFKSAVSMSLDLHYGGLGDNEFFGAGTTLSGEMTKQFEVFVSGRLNTARVDLEEFDLPVNIGPIRYKSENVTYMGITFGFNAWITEELGLTLYAQQFIGDNIHFEGLPFGGSLITKF